MACFFSFIVHSSLKNVSKHAELSELSELSEFARHKRVRLCVDFVRFDRGNRGEKHRKGYEWVIYSHTEPATNTQHTRERGM